MQTREPEQIVPMSPPAQEVGDAPTSAQLTLWSGWRGPLIGALVAVIVVFAVLDIGRALFPLRATGTTRPIIIQVQNNSGGPGTAAVPPALAASPKSLDLACGQSATIALTNTTDHGIHWTMDTLPDGITLSSASPHGGGLAPGGHTTLQVISLGRSTNETIHFTEDRGTTLDVTVRVQC